MRDAQQLTVGVFDLQGLDGLSSDRDAFEACVSSNSMIQMDYVVSDPQGSD